ncbi:MAG: hypothetical protein GY769_00245 [bacterium]|nr:hypothetical protein [bacterium]
MNLEATLDLARAGRLYPSLILHGGTESSRREAVLQLAKCLLCDGASDSEQRPCGACRHCKRITWPDRDSNAFHPDFQVLERDLKTVTSVDATKEFLRGAQVTPFEAQGQVFVIASAETLSGEAANVLLKVLEEPPGTTPRHFLMLAPSQFDLLPTLRSRSLALFLGTGPRPRGEELLQTAADFGRVLESYLGSRHAGELLAAAAVLKKSGKWDDPRARGPWERAAAAILDCAESQAHSNARRALLALAADLLEAPRLRLRGIPADRILEGCVSRRLAGLEGRG